MIHRLIFISSIWMMCACSTLVGQTRSDQKHNKILISPALIPAHETMTTAWDYPKNPLTDSMTDHKFTAEQIKWGFEIFLDTPNKAGRFSGNKLSCNNCHLNAGQKDRAMALVGIAGLFPEYNKRAGRLISLEDRIVECFMRSSNATAYVDSQAIHGEEQHIFPTTQSKEVLALSAYISWLSEGYPVGKNVRWRGGNTISSKNLIHLDKLDPNIGKQMYAEKCESCHGADGQGVQIGDKRAGPLWGPDSWNDGAGAARIYTLAGIIRYMMPYLSPGSLTDEEAQHIAAYINSMPRPVYPFKDKDYLTEKIPPDAVYYHRQNEK